MTSRLKHINPVQLGIVCAVLYFLVGIIAALVFMASFGLITSAMGSLNPVGRPSTGMGSPIGFIFFPFLYAIGGFIGGLIMGWLYNIVAGWTGGVEIRLESVSVPHEVPA